MTLFKISSVKYSDSPNIDAFGRLRVSQLTTQFDGKQIHDALPLFYETETSGTGASAHSTTNAESTLTTAANADRAIMQTKQRFNYSSGKSALGIMTFRNFNPETNVAKRVGYFNSSTAAPYTASRDGFYLETDDTDVSFVVAKNGTENTIARTSWNIDVMDGTGVSGVDLDMQNEDGNLIWWFQYEWLGVGAITMGFVMNSQFYPAHRIDHIGGDGVYMSSPNHSLRYEIMQSGAGSGTLRAICSTFSTEGTVDQIGKDGGISDDGTHLNANNTANWYYAIGLQLNVNKLDTLVDVLGAELKSDTNDDFEWRVCVNPTYAGTVTYNTITDYSVNYGLGATANTVSAFGHILKAGYGVQASLREFDLKTAIRLGASLDGTSDEIVLAVKPHTSNLDIHRAMNWRELT